MPSGAQRKLSETGKTLKSHSPTPEGVGLPWAIIIPSCFAKNCYRPGGGWFTINYYRKDPPFLSLEVPPPHAHLLGWKCPPPEERRLSMPETGEKEKDYLFKELYKLKSNDLMSSLRSQSPLEYPQMYNTSFPLCPVSSTISQKK